MSEDFKKAAIESVVINPDSPEMSTKIDKMLEYGMKLMGADDTNDSLLSDTELAVAAKARMTLMTDHAESIEMSDAEFIVFTILLAVKGLSR